MTPTELERFSHYLYLQQLKSFSLAIQFWAVDSFARVEPTINCLFFYSSPNKLSEFLANIKIVLNLAYLKLGCTSISVWCGLACYGVYNINSKILPGNMATLQEAPPKWVSFEDVATVLNSTLLEVERMIEDGSIPVLRKEGQWRLSYDSATDLIQSHYQQKVNEAIGLLGGKEEESTPQLIVESAASTLESERTEEELLPYLQKEGTQTALHNPPASMVLPEGYSVKGARTRNPIPSAALRDALNALPNAGTSKGRYLERIMLKKADGMQFLSAIASQYNKPEETLAKLKREASKLWDEVNQEEAA